MKHRVVAIVVLLGLLAGCRTGVEEVHMTEPPETDLPAVEVTEDQTSDEASEESERSDHERDTELDREESNTAPSGETRVTIDGGAAGGSVTVDTGTNTIDVAGRPQDSDEEAAETDGDAEAAVVDVEVTDEAGTTRINVGHNGVGIDIDGDEDGANITVHTSGE